MNTKKEITLGQKIWYALGNSSGRQFITALVSTYILVFLTDVYGVPVAAAGVIMTCATIWDAINDPILGSLADRTRTRWGKYRPYLLFVPLPLSIVAVLLFAAPDLPVGGKIAYSAVLYICYGMLVTSIEIPYNAVLPTMSRNEMEKNDTITASTFVASLVIMVSTSLTTPLVDTLGKGNLPRGYMMLVGIGAVLMCITTWGAFLKCKEKYVVEKENEPIRESLKKLLRVKEMYPMIAFWCVGCILFQIIMTSSVYYCTYYLVRPDVIPIYMVIISVSGLVGIVGIMPVLLRKLHGSMRKAVTYTQSIAAVCYVVLFFVGGKSMPVLYAFTFIACMFSAMTNAFRMMTSVGMTDFVMLAEGEQLNGTISAINGFAYKCGTAISNALLAGVLAATGYIANAVGQEPEAVLIGINSVRFLVPLAATILYIVLIQFYPEKKMAELRSKLEEAA